MVCTDLLINYDIVDIVDYPAYYLAMCNAAFQYVYNSDAGILNGTEYVKIQSVSRRFDRNLRSREVDGAVKFEQCFPCIQYSEKQSADTVISYLFQVANAQ